MRHKWLLVLFLGVVLIINPMTAKAAAVKVETVGFFNHPPLFKERDAIKEVCQEFGDQVELNLYFETSEEGQKFMKDKNLSGHLPLVLYVNGSLAHKIGDRTVVFRDFMNKAWTKADLKEVIRLNLAGQKTAVAAPPNATSDSYDPKATTAQVTNSKETDSSSVNYYFVGGAVILAGTFVVWRRMSRGEKK